jgi:hypothetical protein
MEICRANFIVSMRREKVKEHSLILIMRQVRLEKAPSRPTDLLSK